MRWWPACAFASVVVALGASWLLPPTGSSEHLVGEIYTGTHSGGGTVELAVLADGSGVAFVVTNITCVRGQQTPLQFFAYPFLPLLGHEFTDDFVSGTFPAAAMAEGTVEISQPSFPGVAGCESGRLTWTAMVGGPPPRYVAALLAAPRPPGPQPTPASRPPATPAPSPGSPAPAPPAEPGTVLVEEEFSDPARGFNWGNASDNARIYRQLENDELALELRQPGGYPLLAPVRPVTQRDVTVSIDARLVGDVADRFVSVECRYASSATARAGYQLRVMPGARTFALGRLSTDPERSGAFGVLERFEPFESAMSEAIRPENEANRLEIRCVGDTVIGAVNGSVLATVTDATYDRGSVAFGIGSEPDHMLTVRGHFDNLKVTSAAP